MTKLYTHIRTHTQIIICMLRAKTLIGVPRAFSDERTFFSTNGAGITGYPHAKE